MRSTLIGLLTLAAALPLAGHAAAADPALPETRSRAGRISQAGRTNGGLCLKFSIPADCMRRVAGFHEVEGLLTHQPLTLRE
jgi:hypothetical protein